MAAIDSSLIVIDKIIIHDVPKHKKNEEGIFPKYSENESELTDGLRLFFKNKINTALQSDIAFKVSYKTVGTESINISSSPLHIVNILSNNEVFISESKEITKNLFNVQVGNNAAGIVLIINGQISDKPICIILKLERDKGAQLKLDEATRTFHAKEVENLMLTEKTKIFKVAFFFKRSDFGVNFDGIIADYQINIKAKKDANTFFMDDFLGCKAFEDSRITTKYFYDYTYAFIEEISDPIIKAKYIQDLNSYLQMNQATISPREFANNYLSTPEHKNDYKRFLDIKSFPFEPFIKENTLIDSHIKKILIDFDNGISILGKNGTLGNEVKLTDQGGGFHKAEITSKIKEIK